MTVLSRQSILKYMQRGKDPLEIYTIDENGQRRNIPESQINSHTVNLKVGHTVGELDLSKIEEGLEDVFYLDRYDFLAFAGINPTRHRRAIENSLRILDLNRLENYSLIKEGEGDKGCYSWIMKTKDNYVFSTRVIRDEKNEKKACGIILHPEFYWLNMLKARMFENLSMINLFRRTFQIHLSFTRRFKKSTFKF